jgi:radical SAM superfamily enzyme YgiQ (UPF0313 family)
MMLHCGPPYRPDLANSAIGYLKGFLEVKGIPVKNVYWNLILLQEIQEFNKGMEFPGGSELFTVYAVTTYLWRHLMAEDSHDKKPIDPIFSSVLSREELSQLIELARNKIDRYITENNLYKTSIAGFTMKSYQWFLNSHVISRLKELNPDMTIVMGGISDADQGRKFLKIFPQCDFAIWGEGEYPLFYLIESLEEGEPLEKVPQLIYRDDGNIISNSLFDEHSDLDEYPFADHSDYFDTLQRLPPIMRPIIPIWGSRSCPWNKCKFCSLNEGYSYRSRSLENIMEEIEFQTQKYNCDNFYFVDTELPGSKKRFKTLLKHLIQLSAERNEPYHFFGGMSPIFIDPETANLMRLASFESMQVGFEAVTDALLEKMQKRQKFAHNIQVLKLGKRYQLNLDALNVIRGIPTETLEDILESCNNLKFLRFLFDTYTLLSCSFALYKGSPFYNEMPEKEREAWNYNPYWIEIAPTRLIPEPDRFEFLGFFKPQHGLWDDFEMVMKFYKQQNYTYTWIEYPNGSFIEEKGPKTYRFTLDRDETDILIFCDLVKSFREVKEKFSHIPEARLRDILHTLNKVGFLYYDRNMDTIISVLDMTEREFVQTHS